VRLVFALLLAALVAAPSARADGDPASDVLIGSRVFYPYTVKPPKASAKKLEATIAAAAKHGYPVRVAMIGDVYDLGSAGLLMDKPQVYAKFLATELGQFNADWVLIVMPGGYGIYHCVGKKGVGPCEAGRPTAADERLLKSLPRPGRDLAAAADVAVRRLAEAHGVSFGGGPLKLILGVVVVAAVAAGGVLLIVRRNRPFGQPVGS
jgi:hypothetical protein